MTEFNELQELKDKADLMGVKYHPAIGVDKLREKVRQAMEPKTTTVTEPECSTEHRPETEAELRTRLKREANKLVRVRLSLMNPIKKNWPGEIFTVSNKYIGTIRKFVPYNGLPYHIPQAILTVLEDRHYTENFETTINGKLAMRKRRSKEFAIEKLPSLTQKEINVIAERQRAMGMA
jgi:hypothetical protein